MKNSRLRLFAFRPEHYRQMEDYLNGMMAEGWKLKWCRGIFAQFEPADQKLRYGVDPHAMTSLAYFRRYPKRRLQERMREGWHGVTKTKGCQIFATVKEDAPPLTPEQDISPLIKSTCRLASLIWVLLLAAAGMWISTQEAVIYSIILTNLYLVLGVLAVFLVGYHAVNAILLTVSKKTPDNPRSCKRYLVHSAALLVLLLAAISLEMGGRNDMLMLLAIPVVVIAGGMILLQALSGGAKDTSRLLPVVVIFSVILFSMIIFLNNRMSRANADWSTQQQELLLEQADSLPVLHLSDLGDTETPQQAAQTNRSILGDNLLYAEESGFGYIFTNHTVTQAPFLAEQLFNYLYQQAQMDFGETFVESEYNGRVLHILKQANTALLLDGASVYYFTVPEGNDLYMCVDLLLARSNSN